MEEEACELIKQGYLQTSRKYGHVAKVPDGMTPFEALEVANPEAARRAWEQFQRNVRSQYLRVYVPEEYTRTVGAAVLNRFRELGGGVA